MRDNHMRCHEEEVRCEIPHLPAHSPASTWRRRPTHGKSLWWETVCFPRLSQESRWGVSWFPELSFIITEACVCLHMQLPILIPQWSSVIQALLPKQPYKCLHSTEFAKNQPHRGLSCSLLTRPWQDGLNPKSLWNLLLKCDFFRKLTMGDINVVTIQPCSIAEMLPLRGWRAY